MGSRLRQQSKSRQEQALGRSQASRVAILMEATGGSEGQIGVAMEVRKGVVMLEGLRGATALGVS